MHRTVTQRRGALPKTRTCAQVGRAHVAAVWFLDEEEQSNREGMDQVAVRNYYSQVIQVVVN